jgi:hypothetical protein
MLNYNLNIIGSQRDRTVRKAPPLPFGEFYIQLQVVGGGGAGSPDIGGGGGAGGVQYVPSYLINDEKTYTVNVAASSSGYYAWRATHTGSGWNSDPPIQSNTSGSNSYFRDNVTLQDIIGYGGGMAGGAVITGAGNKGGSGGGGSEFGGAGGPYIGLFNTGSNGGDSGPSNYKGGGGGGGATSAGITGNSQFTANASNGGDGIAILGFESGSNFVAGGGGGARNIGGFASGGTGGGGNSGYWDGDISSSLRPQNGTPNTGGGGGGLYGVVPNQYTSSFDTGGGGSGLVIIYYKGIQQAIGGQVETRELNDGFYTQHIYTASGQFIPTSHR